MINKEISLNAEDIEKTCHRWGFEDKGIPVNFLLEFLYRFEEQINNELHKEKTTNLTMTNYVVQIATIEMISKRIMWWIAHKYKENLLDLVEDEIKKVAEEIGAEDSEEKTSTSM